MGKVGKPRFVLWILIAVLLMCVAYVYKTGDRDHAPANPPRVSEAVVISDFREMKDIAVPMEAQLGGKFYATELLFPEGFKGQVDDVFYVRMEDGHILETVSYRIDKLTGDTPTKATYIPIRDHGADFVPDGDYTVKGIGEQSLGADDSK